MLTIIIDAQAQQILGAASPDMSLPSPD